MEVSFTDADGFVDVGNPGLDRSPNFCTRKPVGRTLGDPIGSMICSLFWTFCKNQNSWGIFAHAIVTRGRGYLNFKVWLGKCAF